jgi:hypothetical protein
MDLDPDPDPDPDPGVDLDPDIFVIDLLKMISKKVFVAYYFD